MIRTKLAIRTTPRRLATMVGFALAVFSASTFAAISWTFTGCANGVAGATCSQSTSGVTATAQAWSNTANTGGGTNNAMQTAYLRQYGTGGLGVTNQDRQTTSSCLSGQDCSEADGTAPEHAVDNNGRFDSILFTFSDAIKLTQVKIGWPTSSTTYDSDITVLAYEGLLATPSLTNLTFAGMVAAGWKLAGNYGNVANLTNDTANVNTTYAYDSKYWLIGAYNPNFGATTGLDKGNDYVKFLTLAGDKTTRQVPEPNALLLLGIAAMAGFWSYRNRQRVTLTARSTGK